MKSKFIIDIIGFAFGRWKVVEFFGRGKGNKAMWLCRCQCGKEKVLSNNVLRTGHSKSCGCLKSETSKRVMRRTMLKHGLSKTYFTSTWQMMNQRCYNPESKNYHRYGARGIRMCEYIRSSPASLSELLGGRPPLHTVDRINNDGNYSCGVCSECVHNNWATNIQWATRKQQARNRHSNLILEIDGQSKTLAEWSEISGVNFGTIQGRLERGKSGLELISIPQEKYRHKDKREH